MGGISVAIAAYNERGFIRRCLDSVSGWADEIVVVDGSSTDGTAEIARDYTPNVLVTTNKLMLNVNKNIAIDAATCEWVLVLDPDESVSPPLAQELRAIADGDGAHEGYWIPRRTIELGGWVRRMGLYPDEQLRLFRNGSARFRCAHIHETVDLRGSAGRVAGELLHEPRQSLFEYVHKRNLYSEHRARHLFSEGAPFRLSRLLARPLWAFAKAYFLKGGWREGVRGLVMCASGAYGTFLQDAKLWQLHQDGGAPLPATLDGGVQ
jgi:glycosyltransferase involved in cell wall biosynthesis